MDPTIGDMEHIQLHPLRIQDLQPMEVLQHAGLQDRKLASEFFLAEISGNILQTNILAVYRSLQSA
jgi:hypothetical protein